MKLGLSGRLTRFTIASPLTPLFLLAAIAVGLLALVSIPREEEPQISVPMVDIQVAAPGLAAADAVELIGVPLETIVKSVNGVEHVYTQAEDNGVLVTARFLVGSNPEDAAIRIEEKLRANQDRIPVGVPDPKVTVRGIDDVPAIVLTLTPKPGAAGQWTDQALYDLAHKLRTEIAKVDDVGLTFITGGRPDEIRIAPDPAKLNLYGVPLGQVMEAASQANRSFPVGNIREDGQAVAVTSGRTLASAQEVGLLTVRSVTGAPVYLRDVADVAQGPREDQARVWRWARHEGQWAGAPAVSLAIAKRAGANAVVVSEAVRQRVENLKGKLIPEGVEVAVSRDYGETANEKANELLFHLALATVSIVVLIGFAIGWREAAVTAMVIPTTILLTLFASYVMGYTINRVSLFALIFSIGILVDDAIVMIENIARHWGMRDGRSRTEAAVEAVAEVGNPTVVATLTVVAALLPMLFVSGLMGPYMAPIPVNASAAMIFSFFVAVVIVPWLMIRFARKTLAHGGPDHAHEEGGGKLGRLYARVAHRVIGTRASARNFLIGVAVATLLACSMFYFKAVTVKLLPFDNKSEIQVVVDMPEGTSLEATARTLDEAAAQIRALPEAEAMEVYAGASAPFNFNGLVRHYFLRDRPEMGDLMISLLPKDARSRSSHAVALDLRARLKALSLPAGASIKVVETPPGPPVLATLLAEIYGPDAETRRKTALEVEKLFRSVPYVVDVDNSFGQERPRLRLIPIRDRLDYYGLSERELQDSIGAILGGSTVGYAPRGDGRAPPADHRRPAPVGAQLEPHPGHDAGRRDGRSRRSAPDRTGRGRGRPARDRQLRRLPPRRTTGRHGDRRTGGPVRGARLRHAGGESRHSGPRLGRPGPAKAGDPSQRPAGGRVRPLAAVGRRVGDHLGHLPRHGRRLHGRPAGHLCAGRGPVPQFQTAPGHPDPHPPDLDRHRHRPHAVRRAVHGHLDDRLHRPGRHHRAQFDPAGGLHPAHGFARQTLARRPDRGRRHPVQADPADRPGGHDRGGGDPDGPDLPGFGDLAAVRPGLLDPADRPGHSRHLCRVAG